MFYKLFALLFFVSAVAAQQLQEDVYRIFNAQSGTTVRSNAIGAPLFVSTDPVQNLYELVSFSSLTRGKLVDLSHSCWVCIVGGEASSRKSGKFFHYEKYWSGRVGGQCKHWHVSVKNVC